MFSFDSAASAFVVDMKTAELSSFFGAITHLGDSEVLAVLTIALCGWLYARHRHYALPFCIASIGSACTVRFLKLLIAEPRPDGALVSLDTYAFPSGHAAASMMFFGFLIFLVLRLRPRWYKSAITAFAVLILCVGFSRMYLGVHYLSDVIAGYAVGLIWIMLAAQLSHKR